MQIKGKWDIFICVENFLHELSFSSLYLQDPLIFPRKSFPSIFALRVLCSLPIDISNASIYRYIKCIYMQDFLFNMEKVFTTAISVWSLEISAASSFYWSALSGCTQECILFVRIRSLSLLFSNFLAGIIFPVFV